MYKIALSLSVVIFLGATAAKAGSDEKPIIPDSAVAEAEDCPQSSEMCKIVCKTFPPPTGTRLGGHTECRTRHWWEDRMRQDQATTVKLQENGYKKVTPGR